MSAQGLLLELAGRRGIEHGYHDIWGNWHALSEDTARASLAAMGVDTSSDAALAQALNDYDEGSWQACAPPVLVIRDGDVCETVVNMTEAQDTETLRWSIDCEDGAVLSGEQPCSQLLVLEQRLVNEVMWRRCRLELPDELPHGYHQLHIAFGESRQTLTLIRTPARCAGVADERLWGVNVQLYSLRSQSNWGMGDFEDLRGAMQVLAAQGADFVGLNPLHALHLDTPSHVSPYSPSSRLFINALYLHVESMLDFHECAQARELVDSVEFQASLNGLRRSELVDYVGVSNCKRIVLERLFEHFERAHLGTLDARQCSARAQEFSAFCDAHGSVLRQHAVFEVLHEHFFGLARIRGFSADDAPKWPSEFLVADGPAVAEFVAKHERRVTFFQYLQWQCELQLQACRDCARELGMRIGLYLDLAVGSDGAGADVWREPDKFAVGLSIGAPADDLGPQGQVWGLPPLLADRLYESAYAPFIRCLRTNMRYAGALRIDHILGLLRLFWVPQGGSAIDGAYVHYPVEDLLAITALESERAQCVVVGEDLGTVPDAMRDALARFGVLSYRVFYFEKHWRGDHSFVQPHQYPRDAMVTLTTHDLPTFAGYWSGLDLEVRRTLGLFSSEQFEAQQRETREYDRERIINVLREQALWPPHDEPSAVVPPVHELPPPALVDAIYRFLARSRSSLLSVQIEDALGVVEQTNVPGTVSEQPNWQRKLPVNVEQWREHSGLIALCAAIRAER